MATNREVAAEGIDWGECLVPLATTPPDLATHLRKLLGVVPDWTPRVAPNPWLARAYGRLAAKPVAHLPSETVDLIALVVSQDNSCRYCYGTQRAFFKILGYSAERIAQLERDFHIAAITAEQRAALDFTRRVSRAHPRPGPQDVEPLLRLGFSHLAIAEIVFVTSASAFNNRLATLLALPPGRLEAVVEWRFFTLLRPLVARRIRGLGFSAPEAASEPTQVPFGAVVAGLDGSPAAGALRRILDEAFASTFLPTRTKALMMAVIAKALDCARSEAAARALAADAGVAPRVVDDVLATLGSSALDARERRLIPFARETVRYDVRTIQQRMREVSRGLTHEEILEVVGIIGLGNALGRASVALDLR
jgi:alkylhydroperoxidase family enzyme